VYSHGNLLGIPIKRRVDPDREIPHQLSVLGAARLPDRRVGAPPPPERRLRLVPSGKLFDGVPTIREVRGLQALMGALFFTEQPVEALRVGERAVALNPNDTELLAHLGSRVGQAGEHKRGMDLMEQALVRNPGHSGYYNGVLAQLAYLERNYKLAEVLMRQVSLEKFPLYRFVSAIIYAQLGRKSEAASASSGLGSASSRGEAWDGLASLSPSMHQSNTGLLRPTAQLRFMLASVLLARSVIVRLGQVEGRLPLQPHASERVWRVRPPPRQAVPRCRHRSECIRHHRHLP
jgi:hypothetical protein